MGSLVIDDESLSVGGRAGEGNGRGDGKGKRGGTGGMAGSVYGLFLAADGEGTPGEAVKGIEPRVQWVSVADGTRAQGDMEDRAAKYLPETNMLLINADFRVYLDMVERWRAQYQHAPGAKAVVEDTVREWFEQLLVEAVMGIHSLKGSPEWDMQTISQAWSPEALTASVMPRYHTEMAVRRSLGARLGSLKVS